MLRRAVYPGSFDPITYGHIDIIKRAKEIFPELIIAVAHNPAKNPLFTVQERLKMLRQATKGMKGLIVDDFDGLVIDYCRKKKARTILRGLRMISDFEYEFQMALINRKLSPKIETIFLMPHESYSYLSSRLLKEAASLGADLSCFVPPNVERELKRKLKDK